MRTANPTIKLFWFTKGDHELRLHRRYKKHRVIGEWFDIDANEVIKYFDSSKALPKKYQVFRIEP
jgi:hypothetical protein